MRSARGTGTRSASLLPVFDVQGGPAGIDDAYRHAYRDWLPASGDLQAFPYDFEQYEKALDLEAEPSEFSVWMPIRKKE